ncbi:hypothetical protein [Bacillus sp. B15-48]|nr:hypothetical protein [Bacillus sp. B15-48]MBM4763563.1 hypothetical protein [Bacillus sp. B15-48]
MTNKDEKCYCLAIFRKKYGNDVQGNCLKTECARYSREKEKEKDRKDAN